MFILKLRYWNLPACAQVVESNVKTMISWNNLLYQQDCSEIKDKLYYLFY